MSLIDRVIDCDENYIKCETDSHKAEKNPLTENGKLASIILIEYASQAAGIHASLNQRELTQGKPAYIGSIKNVKLFTESLENINETLILEARCILSNAKGAIYDFSVYHRQPLAEGRVTLVLPK
ncbi:MAG: hypothetical protein JXA04_04050 [Gammaproteobacteria bacterium]|nr:hypothetical protein [Gammaproteobacteria bacterium]